MKPITLARELGAYFEQVEIGTAMMLSSLIEQGLSPMEARQEFARLHKARFQAGDPDGLVERALKAGIWSFPRGRPNII